MTDTNDNTVHPGGEATQQPVAGPPAGPQGQQYAPIQQPPAAPQPTYGQPAAPAPARKLGTGVIVGIASGAVAVVAAIVLVIALIVAPAASKAQAGGASGAGASPADVVRSFLTALTKNDPKTALSHVHDISSTTYLTKKMVSASNTLAPFRHITLGKGKVSAYTASIPVSYDLGDQHFQSTLSLFNYKGTWQLDDPTVSLYVDSLTPFGLTINGVPVKGDRVKVLPGAYEFAVSNPAFTLDGETRYTVSFGANPDLYGTKATLSEEGLATFHDVVGKAVDECMASKSLDAGCGIRVPGQTSDGTSLVDGTIERTLDDRAKAKLTSMKGTPSVSNPLIVEGEFIGSVNTRGTCQKGGQTGPCELLFGGAGIGRPSVDFSATPPRVLWG